MGTDPDYVVVMLHASDRCSHSSGALMSHHTHAPGVLRRRSFAEPLQAGTDPSGRGQGASRPAPRGPADSIVSRRVPGPSRDGADTSDASAAPPLTALASSHAATKSPRNPSCGRFCGRFAVDVHSPTWRP